MSAYLFCMHLDTAEARAATLGRNSSFHQETVKDHFSPENYRSFNQKRAYTSPTNRSIAFLGLGELLKRGHIRKPYYSRVAGTWWIPDIGLAFTIKKNAAIFTGS